MTKPTVQPGANNSNFDLKYLQPLVGRRVRVITDNGLQLEGKLLMVRLGGFPLVALDVEGSSVIVAYSMIDGGGDDK